MKKTIAEAIFHRYEYWAKVEKLSRRWGHLSLAHQANEELNFLLSLIPKDMLNELKEQAG